MDSNAYENPAFSDDHVSLNIDPPKKTITYSWNDINVFALPDKSLFRGKHALREEKQIIKNVTGICRPGELLAIMGASGAGKTTLLNVIGSRTAKTIRIEGNLFVNGEKFSRKKMTSESAYVQQEDLFVGTCTVREQLLFQAQLRMDKHITKKRKLDRIEKVIEQMGLKKCSETLIGIPGLMKGISGGEMKRLSFACEVLTDPPLMLCDEPTTGLDSFMALTIVSAMETLAKQRKTIISTIHQPSSEVFAIFDRVLLLAEGRVAFLGSRAEAVQFFSRMDKTCPLNYNPADFFIGCLAIQPDYESECKKFVKEICDAFADSDVGKDVAKAVMDNMQSKETSNGKNDQDEKIQVSPYKVGWFTQFWALIKRAFQEMFREPRLLRIKLIQSTMEALLIGIIFLNTDYGDYDTVTVQNTNSVSFLLLASLSFQFAFGVINTFCNQLPTFLREHLSGMYATSAYYITKVAAEIPGTIILPLIYLAVAYFLVGFTRSVKGFFTMGAVLILNANAALSFGYLISCISDGFRMALALAAPMLIPFMIFGGFFLNSDTVPVYFIWMKYISWFNYANEGVLITQWREVDDIECGSLLPICYHNGQEVLDFLGYDEDHLWWDFLGLFGLTIFFHTLAFLILLRKTYRLR